MTATHKRFTHDEELEISRRIVRQYRAGAKIIESSGRRPAPIEKIGRYEIDHAMDFTDPDHLKTPSKASIKRIKEMAIIIHYRNN